MRTTDTRSGGRRRVRDRRWLGDPLWHVAGGEHGTPESGVGRGGPCRRSRTVLTARLPIEGHASLGPDEPVLLVAHRGDVLAHGLKTLGDPWSSACAGGPGHPRRQRADERLAGGAIVVVISAGSLVIVHGSPKYEPSSSSYGEVRRSPRQLRRCAAASGSDRGGRRPLGPGVGRRRIDRDAQLRGMRGAYVERRLLRLLARDRRRGTHRPVHLGLPLRSRRRAFAGSPLRQRRPTRSVPRLRNVGLFMARRVVHLDVRVPRSTPIPPG